ncbi:hypothetical protein ACHAPT_007089 [Fusarium lateritium]
MSSSTERSDTVCKISDVDNQTCIEPPDQEVKHLIVDDNPLIQRLLTKSLLKLGIRSHKAENGKDAVDIYKTDPGKCRFIFMDQSMPIMGGVEASRAIRDYEEENGLTPAFIVSLHASAIGPNDPDAVRAREKGGIDTAIAKPVLMEPLKALLESHPV